MTSVLCSSQRITADISDAIAIRTMGCFIMNNFISG